MSAYKSKCIRCIETGKIYKRLADAYIDTGISETYISKCLNGETKTAGGCHWDAVESPKKARSRRTTPSIKQTLKMAAKRERETGKPVSYGDIRREFLVQEVFG